jgi:predicted Fe-Mo cluster-binding NifX family protein
MKIAITSSGKSLTSDIDPRFGRATHFVLVDPETMAHEGLQNKQNLNLPQGAGIQAAKTIIANQVDVLITGHCGPKAFKVLQAAGIKIMLGAKGCVADVVNQFKNNELQLAEDADVEGHWV